MDPPSRETAQEGETPVEPCQDGKSKVFLKLKGMPVRPSLTCVFRVAFLTTEVQWFFSLLGGFNLQNKTPGHWLADNRPVTLQRGNRCNCPDQ